MASAHWGHLAIGNPAFAHAFNTKLSGRSFRYVNDHDVVTHVPPPIGYEHVDLRRFIGPDGSVSSGEPAIPHFFADLIGRPETLLEMFEGLANGTLKSAPTFLLDHMPKAYAIWMWNDYDAKSIAADSRLRFARRPVNVHDLPVAGIQP